VNTISPNRIRAARVIAIGADVLEIALLPLLFEGFLSPLEDVLDVLVFVALTSLVGWHPAFLPSFVTKLAPVLDLAPTWTLAVFFATRQKRNARPATVEIVCDVPSPPPEIKRLPGA
jgi:hypothetical protein